MYSQSGFSLAARQMELRSVVYLYCSEQTHFHILAPGCLKERNPTHHLCLTTCPQSCFSLSDQRLSELTRFFLSCRGKEDRIKGRIGGTLSVCISRSSIPLRCSTSRKTCSRLAFILQQCGLGHKQTGDPMAMCWVAIDIILSDEA